MDPAQVGVSGGTLALTAVQRPCTANNGATYGYASGLVNTYHSFTFTYGYVEARIFLPAAGGTAANFPAFWADGTGDWPSTGELDVMEVLNGCGAGAGFHFHSTLGAFGSCAPAFSSPGWHTYAANWQPGVVTYYYDGQQVGQVTAGITGAPMYLILNNSVDPTYGGAVTVPASLQVDYVRVWQ
jgi:beta-glucanase (GH16 family)